VAKTTQHGALCSLFLTTYHSGDQVKKAEMGGECSKLGECRDAYRILVGNPAGRRPLGRPRR
jgi:hypothetical protein